MKAISLLTFLLLIIALSACKKATTACFQVRTAADSIRIGRPVKFDASCSSASKYYWEPGDGTLLDGTRTDTMIWTYYQPGSYTITLRVSKEYQTARDHNTTSQTIVVKP